MQWTSEIDYLHAETCDQNLAILFQSELQILSRSCNKDPKVTLPGLSAIIKAQYNYFNITH